MKLLKHTFAFLAIALTLVSCEDNDDKDKIIIPGPPVGVEIKYEVVASADMITKISYRMGGGDIFFGALNPDTPTQWEKVQVALYTQMPQEAFLEVKCRNTTSEAQNCVLKIYNGTEVIQTVTGTIPPADDNPDTDDTVTTTATVMIEE